MAGLLDTLDDLALLVPELLADLGRDDIAVTPAALDHLRGHRWLGNVRELKNALACALAWTPVVLFGFRLMQGAAGAVLVPNSLALLETTIHEEDRPSAIGTWSGWSAVTTAVGPLLGGLLVDIVSWRWVFACMAPPALFAAGAAWRHVPEISLNGDNEGSRRSRDLDWGGATLATLGLSAITVGLLSHRSGAVFAMVLGAGVLMLVAFVTLKAGVEADDAMKKALLEHVTQEIGAIARPDEIRFAAALPKTRSGKIMRRLLRDVAQGKQTTQDTTTLEDLSVLAALRNDEE